MLIFKTFEAYLLNSRISGAILLLCYVYKLFENQIFYNTLVNGRQI
jgi:hypothetical protein